MPADLRPLKVAQATTQLLRAKHLKQQPAWLAAVVRTPPATDFVRKPLPRFEGEEGVTRAPLPSSSRLRKAKLYRASRITYAEDRLRRRFFKDHPWELARPINLVENDGADHAHCDWSRLQQPGRPLTGESVVQHQHWLMKEGGIDEETAYRTAVKEFSRLRMREAVERKIAVEEALTFDARFYKTELELGIEHEDAVLRRWVAKVKAARQLINPQMMVEDTDEAEAEAGAAGTGAGAVDGAGADKDSASLP
ncbi:mitochondrial ribosomal small subunit component [Savitreella phatthalungensis]